MGKAMLTVLRNSVGDTSGPGCGISVFGFPRGTQSVQSCPNGAQNFLFSFILALFYDGSVMDSKDIWGYFQTSLTGDGSDYAQMKKSTLIALLIGENKDTNAHGVDAAIACLNANGNILSSGYFIVFSFIVLVFA
jgi:hypothetical protein